MPARKNNAQKRRLKIFIFKISRRNVSLYVVNAYKRNVVCKCKRFAKINTYKQCTDKSRMRGNGDKSDVAKRKACLFKCFFGDA